jgi:hypothetical protein
MAQEVQKFLKQACDGCDVKFYESYSGRGMYGKSCVGVVGSFKECMGIMVETIKACEQDIELNSDYSQDPNSVYEFQQRLDSLKDAEFDSMGREMLIVYWPGLEPIEEEEDSGD